MDYKICDGASCVGCALCADVCPHGAITVRADSYEISPEKCRHCKMCVTAKYLDGGCLMHKFLKSNLESAYEIQGS